MKTAIMLHGKPSYEEYCNPRIPSPSNNHWLPRLHWEHHLTARASGIKVFFSTDDGQDTFHGVAGIEASIYGFEFTEFTVRGHFILTETFPELMHWLL